MILHFFSENLARDRPTSQSGVSNNHRQASRAADGVKHDIWYCAVTNKINNPWWGVDFEQVLPVSEVFILGGLGRDDDLLGIIRGNAEIRVGEYS